MGCSASKQVATIDSAQNNLTTMHHDAPIASEAATEKKADEIPEFCEVMHQLGYFAEVVTGYLLDSDMFSVVSLDASDASRRATAAVDLLQYGPPPGPPPRSPPACIRIYEFCNRYPVLAEIGRAAAAWASVQVDSVFVRLTATDRNEFSIDAAFVCQNDIVMPHEIHSASVKQKELYKSISDLWRDNFAYGATGVDHPGDMELQWYSDNTLFIRGVDWQPQTNVGGEKRALWVHHLKENLRSLLHNAEVAEARSTLRGLEFRNRLGAVLGDMLKVILTWPPTDSSIAQLLIHLVHLDGHGPSGRVEMSDRAGNDLTNTATHAFPDPTLLQDSVVKYWTDLCATGTPGVDHATSLTIEALFDLSQGTSHPVKHRVTVGFSVDGVGLRPRATYEDVYRLRPDEEPRTAAPPRITFAGLPSCAGNEQAFFDAFNPALSPILSAAFAWRPADNIAKVVVMLAHVPTHGPAARVAIFSDTECFVGMSGGTPRPPRALHDVVWTLWANFCVAHPNDLPHVLTITGKLGDSAGQTSAGFELHGVWRREDLTPADISHINMLYGLPRDDFPSADGGR
ncbi:unnamed protein product [Cutaneotrichosporon oleaginosum]